MHNFYYFIILLCFISKYSACQSDAGFHAGMTYSSFPIPYNIIEEGKAYPRFSWIAGGGINTFIYKNIGICGNISLNNIASWFDGFEASPSHFTDLELNCRLSYLSFSLLPAYYFGKKKFLFIEGGIYFSYLIAAKASGDYVTDVFNGLHSEGTYNKNIRDEFEQTDYGLCLASGVRINITPNVIMLPKIRYNYGLVEITRIFDKSMPLKIESLVFMAELDFILKKSQRTKKSGSVYCN